MKKKILAALLAAVMVFSMGACGSNAGSQTTGSEETAETQEAASDAQAQSTAAGEKILHTAASFAYPSLDVHKEYYGWYTSIYGISEALFKLDENMRAVSCLAKDAVVDGSTWTVTLNDGVQFSNGNPLTADMVIKNLQRLATENSRFAYFGDFEMTAQDDKTIVIDTKEVYPTLKNDLASPECGMIDLDATTDFDNAPICTGPFVIKEFIPEGDVTVTKNENYWGGDVKLDGAVFYYMQEDDPKLLAMQSGEIDCYNSVSSAALEVYNQSPDLYDVVSIPGARLQFYILNENRLDDAVREAINLTVDKKKIADYLIDITGADSYVIEAAVPYTDEDIAYNNSSCRANQEQNDKTVRPEIAEPIDSLDSYNTVFLGYPIWWGQEPRIIDTFLESYDLSDKTVIPFCTSASSGISTSERNIAALVPIGEQLAGKRFSASASKSDVESWYDSLPLNKEDKQ